MPDSSLASIIEAEFGEAGRFLDLLKEEEGALISGDIEKLSEILQKKSPLLLEISNLNRQRSQLMPQNEIGKWLESHPESGETWKKLHAVSGEIRKINETNGKMIDIRLRTTQQALGLLQSLANTSTGFYGPDGQTSISTSSRHSIESA